MTVKVIEATEEHAAQLAPILREHELEEVSVVSPDKSTEQILKDCIEISEKAFAVVSEKDGCVAMFGVSAVSEDAGVPWMLASDVFFTKYKKRFIKETPDYLDILFGKRKHLYNYVSAKNTLSQKWLKHLGFTIHTQAPIILKDVTFYTFEQRRN